MAENSYGYSNYFYNKYVCYAKDEPKGLTKYKDVCYPHEAYFLPKYEVVKVNEFPIESQLKNQIQKCKFPDTDFISNKKSLMFINSKCSQLTIVKTDNPEWTTFVNKLCLIYDDIHLITNIHYEPIESYKSSTLTGITNQFNCSLKIDNFRDFNYQSQNLKSFEIALLQSTIVILSVFILITLINKYFNKIDNKIDHYNYEKDHKEKMNQIISEMNENVFKD